MTRWIGIDLGSRRIGVAISDDGGRVAVPYATLDRTNDESDARAIGEIAAAEGVKTVVVGYPLSMDGTRGDAAFVVDAFADKLRETGVRVRLQDERLSTVEADKKLKKSGMKARARRAVVDRSAATVILQAFLDARK